MPAPWLSVTGTPLLVQGRKCTPESPEEPRHHSKTDPRGSHTAHQTEPGRGNTLRTRMARPSISLSYNPKPSSPLGFNARVSPAWGGESMNGAEAL